MTKEGGRGNFLAAVCEAVITMKGKEGCTNWDTFWLLLTGTFKRIRGVVGLVS